MPEPTKNTNRRWSGLVNFGKSPSHIYPLGFLLAYGVLFGLYDLRQVPKQRAAILDQSFRRLALASDQIRSRLENIAQVMGAEADRLNATDSLSEADKKGERHLPDHDNMPAIPDFFFLAQCEEKPEPKEGISFQVLPGDKPVILAVLKKGRTHLCGESPLQATIESATHDLVGTGFEDVAVITSTGRVIYQKQSSALRLAMLGDLPSALGAAKHTAADGETSGNSEKETQMAPSGVKYSRIADLEFAERRYKLLLQPIVLPISDFAFLSNADKLPSLELVGVIDGATLTAAARSLPYDWLINVTGFILLALVLTWPVLKIWKMGPAEGFKSGEMLAFGLSMIAAAMLVTLLTCYNSQVSSYESIDNSLSKLANSIDRNFLQEITVALQTLNRVSDSPEVKNELAKSLAKKQADRFQAYPAVFVAKNYLLCNGPSTYQWFNQIFWADEDGNQILKWSTQGKATGKTKVVDQQWFQKVLQGRFWSTKVDSKSESFVLDSVYSPNTTEYFGMIAQVRAFGAKRIVAAIVTPFVSVINPLLSPMDGFAILDEKGLVRFHSDATKNLRENFLNEIHPSQEVRSAIGARTADLITTYYSAKKYRVAVRPISFESNEAWTLVVFRDLSLRQRFFLNTLVLTIIYIASYLFALAGLAAGGILLIRFIATRAKLTVKEDWLRPTTSERFILWVLVALFGLLLVLFRSLTGPDHSQGQYLATVLALPLAGLLGSYFALRYPSAMGRLYRAGGADANDYHCAEPERAVDKADGFDACGRMGVGSALAVALTLLLTLISIFPAVEFFEIAFNDSVVPNMEDAQIGMAKNVLARNNRIYAYVRKVPRPAAAGTLEPDPKFLQARLSETLDRYTFPASLTTRNTTAGKIDCWLPDPTRNGWRTIGLPPKVGWLFANTAGVLKNILPFPETMRDPGSPDSSWGWVEGERAGQSVLEMRLRWQDPQDPRNEDDSVRHQEIWATAVSDFPITNVLPSFRHQNSCGLLMLGLIFSLFWFTRYTMLRRFGLDLQPSGDPIPQASLAMLVEDTTRNVLALNFPRSADEKTLAVLSQLETIQVFSLATLLASNEWKNQLDERTELIVISNFELGIKSSHKRTMALELLEEIVEDPKRKLLLVSTTDPVFFSFVGRLRDLRKLPEAELKMYSRWLNVFSSFETRRICVKKGRSFDQEDWHALWDTCSEREQLALWQLANYGIINPKNTGAIEQLYRRGLLTYTDGAGHFQIFERGFGDFIISELTSRQIELLMSCHKDTAWNGLKWVLIYTGLALPLFLAFTTADFWDLGLGRLMTFGSAGAAALQTINKLADVAGSKLAKGETTG